jgi:hypothetical protein
MMFHNLTSKDLTLDLYRVQKTQAHRAIGCEDGGGEKGQKKNTQPKVQKNLLTAQLREWGKQLA